MLLVDLISIPFIERDLPLTNVPIVGTFSTVIEVAASTLNSCSTKRIFHPDLSVAVTEKT